MTFRLELRLLWFAAGFAACVARGQQPEFRALWADTFHAAMRNSNEVSALVNTARGSNFNAIIVEVRKRGDAYYNSTLEPKATDVTPSGFDPLADLIEKAHSGGRRIEVHAWVTTYLAWNNRTVPPTQTNHPYLLHPEWLSVDNTGTNWDGANYQFDQGLPEVQSHVFNVAMDLISRYDLDGFNFDYVRYSGRTWGYHTNTLERFRRRYNVTGTPASTDGQWLQFRRDQVSGLVRKVYLNAIALKPQLKISADTICFAPGITDDAGWFASSAAWNNVLQDWRGWMREGILDLNIPMMYFDQRRYAGDWASWSIFAKEHAYGRHVALGQGSYLNTLSNVIAQLRTTRTATAGSNAAAAGFAIYSYAVPVTNDTSAATMFNALVNPTAFETNPVPLLASNAPTPVMPWKSNPVAGHLKGTVRSALTSNELDGALVMITGPVSGGRTNDATGFYGFAHLPPGQYSVTASYSNLVSQTATVVISTGMVSTLDFQLSSSNGPLMNLRVFPGRTEALVGWTTSNASDSSVQFGLTPALGSASWLDVALVTNHAVLLTGLLPGTDYFFRAVSRTGLGTNYSTVGTFITAGDIVLDNADAALAGSWTPGTSSADKFGADYVFASTAGFSTATYRPEIGTAGYYDVYVWFPQGANRSTNAPFLISHAGGTRAGGVNQTVNGGGWRLVATNLPFARGTGGYFQWQSSTTEPGKVVMADAVRFSYVTSQEPPPPGQAPRWWTEFFFGGPVDAGLDPDGDGWTTAREYVAGTDPIRAGSALRFRTDDRSGNVLRAAFAPFHPGRAYALECQAELGTNDWVAHALEVVPASASEGYFSVSNLPPPQKYYRLRVEVLP